MEKNLEISLLLDIYGQMLTKKQYNILNDYYNLDNSLGEIAENIGITRQSVRDSVGRSVEILNGLEEKLGFLNKKNTIKQQISYITDNINSLSLSQIVGKLNGILSFLEED